jgi:signal transduction histidine kinase
LVIQKSDSKIVAYFDEVLLSIIIRNLINNAIKFSPENSTIHLKVETVENERTQIHVIDHGVGMTEKQVADLLNKDNNLHESERGTIGEKGFGLGLQICFSFIQKMKGTIRVQSKKNIGSTFIVELPSSDEIKS